MTVVSKTGESEIAKPLTDKRLYRRVELANGMVVLLINDPDMNTDDNDDDDAGSTSGGGGEADDMVTDEEEDEEEEDASESGDDEDGGEDDEASATKKAAVAMCVSTGSFSDPEEIAGVSHFLEHMLFMVSPPLSPLARSAWPLALLSRLHACQVMVFK